MLLFTVLTCWAVVAATGSHEALSLKPDLEFVAWSLPAVKALHNLSAGVAVGSAVVAATLLPSPSAVLVRTLRLCSAAAIAWTMSAIAVFLLTYLQVSNVRLSLDADYGRGLGDFLTHIQTGQAWAAVVLIAALTASVAVSVTSPLGAGAVAVLASSGLVPLALIGHAAGAANHAAAVNALGLHLLGSSIWLGGLVALAVSAHVLTPASRVLPRFSSLAGFAFVLVAASGMVSAWVRLDGFRGVGSPYGSVVLAKIAATLVLGAAGWAHRKWLLDGLGQRETWLTAWRLIAGEIVVMGVVSGLAAGLAATPTPAREGLRPDATPAEILTDEPLPPALTFARWFTEWRVDVLWVAVAAVMVATYVRGFLKLRARGDSWSALRLVSWIFGWSLLVFFTSAGPAVYGKVLFSAHMVEHMALTMTIPVFLVLAAPVTLLLRASSARKDGSRGPREWTLGIVRSRYAAVVSHPLFAAANFVGSIVVFYYTPLFGLSLRTHIGHELMILHFTLTGFLFVESMIGVDFVRTRFSYPFRLITLMATMVFHAFFGISLMASTSLLQASWFGSMGREWGGTALEDQQQGGAVAWGAGEIPTMLLAIMVAVMWARDDTRETRRLDRAADRDDDAELRAYNAMLQGMASRGR